MATWHQMRNPVRLYHESKWTVVIDPPNDCRACMLFDTREAAEAYLAKVKHAYILNPQPERSNDHGTTQASNHGRA